MKLSIVSPIYACSECLTELCRRLVSNIELITSDFEIILVNDASPDNAWEVIESLSKQDARIKGVCFSRNFGQHYAISAGLDYAEGEWVVVMDGDLQDRPEDIPTLYKKALEGYDIVYGYDDQGEHSRRVSISSNVYYWIHRKLTKQEPFNPSFIIISNKVVLTLRQFEERHRLLLKLLQFVGYKKIGIQVTHSARHAGKSSYNFWKRAKLAFFGLTSSTTSVLRFAIAIGLFFSSMSFLAGCYVLINKLFHENYYAGWSSLIVSVFFVGGVIMTLLGILGVYLEIVYDEVKKRPLYIVSDTTNI